MRYALRPLRPAKPLRTCPPRTQIDCSPEDLRRGDRRGVSRPQERGARWGLPTRAWSGRTAGWWIVLLMWWGAWAPGRSQAQGEPQPQTGTARAKTLQIAIDSEPAHLNPVLDPDVWGYRIAHDLICEPLLRRRVLPPGETLGSSNAAGNSEGKQSPSAAFEPVLAERFRLDADGSGIDIVLRNARFHDGRPVTSQDVRATLELVRGAAGPAPRTQALLADIVRIAVEGPQRLRIDLRYAARRDPAALLAALAEIDILPAIHFPGGHLVHQPFNRKPICSGPYRLADWRRGASILLRKNTQYWGPAPAFDELHFRIATDGALGLSLLRQGEVDLLGRVSTRYLTDQVEPAVARGRMRRMDLDANQVVVMLPNLRHPQLGQAAIRLALSQLIDRDRLVREVRKGLGTAQRLPYMDPAATLPPLLVQAPGAQDSAVLAAPPTLGSPPTAARLARRFLDTVGEAVSAGSPESLLDGAGLLRATPGGVRLQQGRPVRWRLLIPSGSSELAEVARQLGESLNRVGIKLDVTVDNMGNFLLLLRRGAFDLALCAWSWTGDRMALDVEPLLSYALPAKAPLLLDVQSAMASARTGRGVSKLTQIWNAAMPLLLLYRPRQVVLFSPRLGGSFALQGDFPSLRALASGP